ncbi:hypothetical protein B7494_g8273 [Chlorociboria aeruginascens]|nr:hypothetical protein B7494_g8273 [Chlorociboria aeruginascens]
MNEDQGHLQGTVSSTSTEENVNSDQPVKEKVENYSPLKYVPLDFTTQEMRFLILEPGEPDSLTIKGSFSSVPLSNCEPYTYVINSRGNPIEWRGLLIDGQVKPVTRNIIVFLHHIQSRETSQRLWFRDVCLDHQDQEEKTRYWNQEWMDTMIQHAEKVIDLSEVMAELWDQGKLQPPFLPMSKEWHNTREAKGAKHYPAPLHMQKGWVEPPPPHEYLPLDYDANEFRLIVLWKADNYDDPLRASLAYSVMHDDVPYHCLSYTWGASSEEPTCSILLNGQIFKIRKNLDRALRKLRHNVHKIIIWVDAICIDQNSIPERNRQIPRILEIYDTANIVISWLGEGDETSDISMDFILLDELKSPKLYTDDEGNWGQLSSKEGDEWKIKPIPDCIRQLAALYHFFLNPYFRRIWVIQELAVSTSPTVLCGKKQVAWSQLDQAAYHLIDILHRSRTMPARMMAADPSLKSISDREISFVRRLFYFRHLRSRNADDMMGQTTFNNFKDTSPGILDVMILSRSFESTSPHDKIFALLNLAQDIRDIDFKPDYSRSLSQTYQEFTVAVANETGCLDIICAAEPSLQAGLTIPTWTADWSTLSTVSSIIRHEHIPDVFMTAVEDISGPIYQACGPTTLTPRFSFNGLVLEVVGIILDTVRLVDQQDEKLSQEECIMKWLSLAVCECPTQDESHSLEIDIPFMEKFWSMLAGDVAGAWSVKVVPPSERAPGVEAHGKVFQWFCARKDLCKTRMPQCPSESLMRGRALIITENGSMGLAPYYVEVGQRLAILNKCSVPVLLQETEDGKYRFQGSAFVQGWMEGEVLEEWGLDCEEAWGVLDEGGRLAIV